MAGEKDEESKSTIKWTGMRISNFIRNIYIYVYITKASFSCSLLLNEVKYRVGRAIGCRQIEPQLVFRVATTSAHNIFLEEEFCPKNVPDFGTIFGNRELAPKCSNILG